MPFPPFLRTVLLIAIVVATGAAVFLAARRMARGSPVRRALLLATSVAMLCASAWLAFWAPAKIPDTPGSPAALIAWLMLIVLACILGLAGVSTLLGAACATRTRSSGG